MKGLALFLSESNGDEGEEIIGKASDLPAFFRKKHEEPATQAVVAKSDAA